jgi:cytochrome P450
MNYLEWCIREAARLEINGSSFRLVMKDGLSVSLPRDNVTYAVPKDYLVCLYTPSVHFNERLFSNPHKFDPERYAPGTKLSHWRSLFSNVGIYVFFITTKDVRRTKDTNIAFSFLVVDHTHVSGDVL